MGENLRAAEVERLRMELARTEKKVVWYAKIFKATQGSMNRQDLLNQLFVNEQLETKIDQKDHQIQAQMHIVKQMKSQIDESNEALGDARKMLRTETQRRRSNTVNFGKSEDA